MIKVEPPGLGDPWRSRGPLPGRIVDYYWPLTSRNKRSLAIDLKHEDGIAVLHRLVATVDVFVTNCPLPVRDRRKLSPAHLLPLNPRFRKDLTDDPRFATPDARKAHARELVDVLDIEFAKRDLSEWRTVLDAVGVTFGIVGTVDETLTDQQMQDSGALVPFADGKTLTVSAPFHLEGVNKIPAKRAPSIGQHSDEILREEGYSADEIGRLRRSGVVA